MTLLDMARVRELVPVSRRTIYALIDTGGFPKGRKIRGKGNKRFWPEAEVRAWIERQTWTAL